MKEKKCLLPLAASLIFGVIMVTASIGFGAPKPLRIDPPKAPSYDLSLVKEAKHTLTLAHQYLLSTQLPNGSWKNDPAITSLVLYAFLTTPSYNPDKTCDQALRNGFSFLEKFVQPDGGIYQEAYKNYTTAVCLLAFTEAKQSKYNSIIANAKQFLIRFQIDEGEGVEQSHAFYGGIGYGGDDRPDLSNTQLALEAIRAAEDYESRYGKIIPANLTRIEKEESEMGLHWRKALVFLARCQNVKSVNDMPYATDDGGFIYETGTYKKDRSHSYGSMTYAGVKSLLHARVDKADIRVRKAVDWIKNHYTFEENPGFGTTSLYYYYTTASKCLSVLGEETITDNAGKTHIWREDLIKKLISLQHEDGFWVNTNGRYWENIKDLATAYALISLKFALNKIISD